MSADGFSRDRGRCNIVHTIATITKDAGGPTYSVTRLCKELSDVGVDTTLLALDAEPGSSVPEFVRTFAYGVGPKRLGRSPAMARWLDKQAASGDVGLIHTHGLWMMPNVYTGWVARRYGTPLVIAPRGTLTKYSMASGSWVKRIFWPLVQRPALEPVLCFHATCEAEYYDIRRLGFGQPVAVIPNGIDEYETRAMAEDEVRTLLYVGRIHPEKGIEELLRAWSNVERGATGWRLRVVGPGDPAYLGRVRSLAKSLNLKNCEFADAVYGADKLHAYHECDAYVLFSLGDNFAMTVAEALMAGRPVLTTKDAPWRGLRDQEAGWWVDTNVEAFSAALREVVSLPRERLQQMGANGRRWMIDDFSWEKIGKDMQSLYDWLLKKSDRPSFVIQN